MKFPTDDEIVLALREKAYTQGLNEGYKNGYSDGLKKDVDILENNGDKDK